MRTVITLLQRDHTRFRRLLILVERQLATLRRSRTLNGDLLKDGLETLDRYLNRVHKPLEGHLLERIHTRLGYSKRNQLQPLMTQDQIAYESHYGTFCDNLRAMCSGHVVHRDKLTRHGSAAIADLRRQMLAEERTLFPLALELLTGRDWQEIERWQDTLKRQSSYIQQLGHNVPRSLAGRREHPAQ